MLSFPLTPKVAGRDNFDVRPRPTPDGIKNKSLNNLQHDFSRLEIEQIKVSVNICDCSVGKWEESVDF